MISLLLFAALSIWTALGLVILFDHTVHSKPARRVALLVGPVLVLIGIAFQLGFNLIKKLVGRTNKA
jgi:hypothetical protein